MGSDREQDLGQTATEAASAAAGESAGTTVPIGATLGRYRLERELGAGGMGVVHAAFDPDLERRIALKVLRGAIATPEARDRLLREARAMARLTHPNVVTVYEVGTASGRDFVAMEMIHGETFAEWLRQAKRPPRAILDAFLAAGRGLAAAHAAGIVHRDFKPHNVLRSRAGRIVVTDFGLAREAEGVLPPALDTTLPAGTESGTPSALVGLTATGSLLGTPAYMAPEQWQGGAVTPATDQFAYCVALWEALSGERPYRGPTFDELRDQVARGPAALDASCIPRRVRGLLRRGLDPAPARRHPSMDALLARLARAQRRPGVALVIAGGALAAAALVFALRPGAPPPACEPPARDVATVWSPAIAAELGAKTSEAHAAVLDAAFRDWQVARTAACTAPPQVRQAQLSCLDGVLARFDALRQAYLRAPEDPAEDLQPSLVDPAVCRKLAAADIPRLTLAPTPTAIAAFALLGRSDTEHKPSEAEITALAGGSDSDPCARVIAALAFDTAFPGVARARAALAEAASVADQCGDERLRADLVIQDTPYHWEMPMPGPKADAATEHARITASRVMQPELEAALASLSRRVTRRRGQWDEAFRLTEIELAGYRVHGMETGQLRVVIARNALRLARAEPGDLRAIAGDVRVWRPIAVAHHRLDLARQLEIQDARARLQLGDVASAHADLVRLWLAEPRPAKTLGSRRIIGEVVDAHGRPVAGATVAAGGNLFADAAGIGLPLFSDYIEDDLRIVTSDAAGRFAIADGAWDGAIVAQLADRRSRPIATADHVTLVLEPTRSVTGKVNLAGTPYTQVTVHGVIAGDPTGRLDMLAPVGPDGSFEIYGATVSALRLGASTHGDVEFDEHLEYRPFPASPLPLTGVALDLASSARVIDVIVRSAVATPLDGAMVTLVPGKLAITTADALMRLSVNGSQLRFARPVTGSGVPAPLLARMYPGDLLAHIEHAGLGDLTVCALNFAGDWMDPEFRQRIQAHFSQLALKCVPIGPDTAVVELLVPPQQRFD